jgi:hypothetical protein
VKGRNRRSREREDGPAPSIASLRAGPAPTIKEYEADGRRVINTWRLGWNTTDAKAHLEMVIVSELTRLAIKRMKQLGGQEGAEYFDLFQSRVDTGSYHTFAPGWRHVMAGLDASWLFLLSLLLEHQPDATPEDAKRLLADEPEQVGVAVGGIAPDFFAAVAVQAKDRDVPEDQAVEAGRAIAAALMAKVFRIPTAPEPTDEPTPEPISEPDTGSA